MVNIIFSKNILILILSVKYNDITGNLIKFCQQNSHTEVWTSE